MKRGAKKPTKILDYVECIYDERHWNFFDNLRTKALSIMKALKEGQLPSIVHGSVARGDVDSSSDVDVVIPYVVPSHRVEVSLLVKDFELYSRRILQATPSHAPKAHIYLDTQERFSVTFPLLQLRSLELDFFKFGGLVDTGLLKKGIRVPGCTKKLTLIEPTLKGHVESPIVGYESEVAKKVGISIDIIKERIRVLTRRDKIGRTGVFLDFEVQRNETFESVTKALIDTNPAIRRVYLTRSKRS